MTTKELLLEQFTACYDENGWFVALKNALLNLTAEQAAWKPENADNSIWETLSHLTFYNEAYLKRFKGIDYEYPVSSNDETFSRAENAADEAWGAEVERFVSVMSEWRKLLEAADEAKFDEAVPNKKTSWSLLISHVNIHNAYHGGQIVLLRKLQDSWDAAEGVN